MLKKNKNTNIQKTNSKLVRGNFLWSASVFMILFSSYHAWAGPVLSAPPPAPVSVQASVAAEQKPSELEKVVLACAAKSAEIAFLFKQDMVVRNYINTKLSFLALAANKPLDKDFTDQAAKIFDDQDTPKYGPVKMAEYLATLRGQDAKVLGINSCAPVKTMLEASVSKGVKLACQVKSIFQEQVPDVCVAVEKAHYREI